jgi:hypothetical protein
VLEQIQRTLHRRCTPAHLGDYEFINAGIEHWYLSLMEGKFASKFVVGSGRELQRAMAAWREVAPASNCMRWSSLRGPDALHWKPRWLGSTCLTPAPSSPGMRTS